jgi:hypothetical protein
MKSLGGDLNKTFLQGLEIFLKKIKYYLNIMHEEIIFFRETH